MSKRDYELIAACIKAQITYELDYNDSPLGAQVMRDFSRRMASELLTTNQHFNTERFLNACGVYHDHDR